MLRDRTDTAWFIAFYVAITLRYVLKVAFYDIRPGERVGRFFQPGAHAWQCRAADGNYTSK